MEHEIKISKPVNEILALRLKTGIDIHSMYIDDVSDKKETLLKKFLEEFKKNDFNEQEEQLNKFIKAACKEVKTPDNIEMQYMQALRMFSEFDSPFGVTNLHLPDGEALACHVRHDALAS